MKRVLVDGSFVVMTKREIADNNSLDVRTRIYVAQAMDL